MTSFYEIGGLIMSGSELENEYAFATGRRTALEHKQRSTEIKLMKQGTKLLSRDDIHSAVTLDEKDSFLEHWGKMATMPARRFADEQRVWALPFKNPIGFGLWGIGVGLEGIKANYYYFVKGESIEEW